MRSKDGSRSARVNVRRRRIWRGKPSVGHSSQHSTRPEAPGLVVLPGAFVGLLLGGASPAEAAQLQLLVLVGLLAAETVCAVLTAYLLAPALAQDPRVATLS